MAAAAVILPLAACGGEDRTAAPFPATTVEPTATIEEPQGPPTSQPSKLPSVEDAPLASASKPLFRLERIAVELREPVYAASPVDSARLYIVLRAGRVRVYEDGKLRRGSFLDISDRVRTQVEEGLHSIAFHPRFQENGRFFAVYNDKAGDVRIVEFHAGGDEADPSSARELFAIDKTEGVKWHNGGQLQFGRDGRLYFAMGDSARNPFDDLPDRPSTPDPNNNAQNLTLPFGKLFRIDVDARHPRPQVVAIGLRNTWRFSFDRRTDDLYLADVGQFGWEELDFLPAGNAGLVNFGWSLFEANAFHNKGFALSKGRLVWPIVRYPHGPGLYCSVRGSITGGYVYRGANVPELAGRYVFGDFCSGEIWTLRVVDGRATEIRKEPVNVPQLVSFAEDAEGELYALSLLGDVHRLAAVR